MTNAELIQKIRAEIERQIKDPQEHCYGISSVSKLKELLSFLSTLEKECGDFPTTDEEMAKFLATHPKVEVPEKYKTPDWVFEESEKSTQEGLEEEYKDYVENDPVYSKLVNRNAGLGIARHFAQWGAEHAKKDEIPVPSDLEEAADEGAKQYYIEGGYSPFPNIETNAYKAGFFAGAKWQAEQLLKGSPLPEDTVIYQKGVEEGKRLMMEEAVEGYVNYYEDSGGILMAEAQVGCPYHNGDKVKLIICKEDEK